MQPTQIAVVNESTKATDADVSKMVDAVSTQLARDVAPIWGMVPSLVAVPKGGAVPAGACVCHVRDTIDVPNAIAYHDEGADGMPYMMLSVGIVLDNGGSMFTGPDSVCAAFSHDIIELAFDSAANRWCADGTGAAYYALELCDGTQGDGYPLNGNAATDPWVSNFLFPAFFDPHAQPSEKRDHMGVCTVSLQTRPAGYQLVLTGPSNVQQVTAAHPGALLIPLVGAVALVIGQLFPAKMRGGLVAKCVRKRRVRDAMLPAALRPKPHLPVPAPSSVMPPTEPAPPTEPSSPSPPPPPKPHANPPPAPPAPPKETPRDPARPDRPERPLSRAERAAAARAATRLARRSGHGG